MRTKLLAGNWKMNKTNAELDEFFDDFFSASELSSLGDRVEVMFAVPYTMLHTAQQIAAPRKVRIAAQNLHWQPQGAFTGEVSIPMLRDVGIHTTLVGHSERRQYFGETDDTVGKKTREALASGFHVIACVGETLEEREAHRTREVVATQVSAILDASPDDGTTGELVIAYEPVWAIGTGKTATDTQAQEVHADIRNLVQDKKGRSFANKIRLLYGGSAKPGNISGLLSQPDIDGGLVGGASLNAADFARMVRAGAEFG